MYSIASDVEYIDGYKLKVTFVSGESGIVDLKDYAGKKGVFSRFADIEYFKNVTVNDDFGVLCWPDSVDIAPETIYGMAMGKPLNV